MKKQLEDLYEKLSNAHSQAAKQSAHNRNTAKTKTEKQNAENWHYMELRLAQLKAQLKSVAVSLDTKNSNQNVA